MENKSRKIHSDQKASHKDLLDFLDRYQKTSYLYPVGEKAKATGDEILKRQKHFEGIILDMGCGVGESTFHLATMNPSQLVVGIDKSSSRLKRNNDFKKSPPENFLLVEGNCIEYWQMFFQRKSDFKITKQYLLYPNPNPKIGDVKKRWHGHPIITLLTQLSGEIELRTNWEIYWREFNQVLEALSFSLETVECYAPENPISPFERKYRESQHDLFQTIAYKPL